MDVCLNIISKDSLVYILSDPFLYRIRPDTTRHLLQNLTRYVTTTAKEEQDLVSGHSSTSETDMITSVSRESTWMMYHFTTVLQQQWVAATDEIEDYYFP